MKRELWLPRYRVQQDFDEIDRSEFRETAFATIRDYFQQQIAEINTVSKLRGRFVPSGAEFVRMHSRQ